MSKKPPKISFITPSYIFRRNVFFLLILIVVPFRFFNVTKPLVDITNFRQAQTATIALNFYKNGINLFQTELDIFGIGKERYLTLEFPLYEAIVALLYKIFFVHDMWGRIVSIFAGFLGALFLFDLIKLLFKNNILAFFACFFFLFAPLNMYHQRDFLIETTAVSFLLAGIYYFCHWVDCQDKKSYFLSISLLGLGFVQKGMYGPFWLLPLTWYYIKRFSKKSIFSLRYILLIGLPLVFLFFWQQHVNYINTAYGHEYFTTYNREQLLWNFGTLSDRLSPSMWQFRLKNLLNGIFLKPGLLLFFLGLIVARKVKTGGFMYVWLLSQIIYFLTFFRIQSHIYYQMVTIPIISFFMAVGLLQIGDWMNPLGKKVNLFRSLKSYVRPIFLAGFCMIFLWKSWLNSQWDSHIDWQWYKRLQEVGRSIPPNSYGIFVNPGYDWNSVYTYYPKLKMKLVGTEEVSPENIVKWRNLGYSYIVLHEYEKYPNYLNEVKPGHSLEFLKNYKEVLSLEDFKVYLLNT